MHKIIQEKAMYFFRYVTLINIDNGEQMKSIIAINIISSHGVTIIINTNKSFNDFNYIIMCLDYNK